MRMKGCGQAPSVRRCVCAHFFRRGSPPQSGLTLIEALLALTISMLVLTWLGSALWSLRRASADGTLRETGYRHPREALMHLAWEWESACDPFPETQGALAVSFTPDESGGIPVLSGHVAFRPDESKESGGMQVRGTVLRMEPDPRTPGLWSVLRIISPETGMEQQLLPPPQTNVVWKSVRSFRVECLYRDQWLKTWPPQKTAGAASVRWPDRLKFEVVLPEGSENILRAETALPAAMIITSRVTRGLAPSVP